ncbi:MAG TPA: hypothetical protein VNC61_10340 [Acidimicrobiales bacterium]|nr:hypothetical protein [Acidimicrobiales bacterium]
MRLYNHILQWEPTAVVKLNRAVAVAMAQRPADGLALLDHPTLSDVLVDYHLYHSTRADLLRRAGRTQEAVRPTDGLGGRRTTPPSTTSSIAG